MEFSGVLVLCLRTSKRSNACGTFISESFIFSLSGISKSKVTNLEIPGVFSKEYVLDHPCLNFFWNNSIMTCWVGIFFVASYLIYLKWLNWFDPLPHSLGQIRSHSDWLHYFPVTISRFRRCYKNVYVNSFLPHTAISFSKLWNSLPVECLLSLTRDLNGFKIIDTFFLWAFSTQLCYILFIL